MALSPFTAVLELSKSVVDLVLIKEKRKYTDALLKLENEYYEEFNSKRPDMATLDNIEHRVLLLGKAINTEARKP